MAETTKKSVLAKDPDGTIKLTISIPQDQVKKVTTEVTEETVKNSNIKGFRKGKAPKKLVEESIDTAKLREEVLRKLIPDAYIKAIQEHNLRPIMNPKIHVEKIDDSKEWEFSATTAEMPEIKLGKYKDEVKKVTAKSKIILPGKEPFDAAQGKKQEPSMDEILKTVMENVETTIPSILVQQEADRFLSQTLDEIKRLGLTLDQYLQSTGKKPEDLRREYESKAASDMKLEFALQKIAEEEKIQIEPQEIDEAIQKAKSPEEKAQMEQNRYLLASILRQQKTLDFLKNL